MNKPNTTIPPGPEIVVDPFPTSISNNLHATGKLNQTHVNRPGTNTSTSNYIPEAVVAQEIVDPVESHGNSNEDGQVSEDEPNPKVEKPWYQNPVTMSFLAFVLILIAGAALGISLITRDSNSTALSNSDSVFSSPSSSPSFCKYSNQDCGASSSCAYESYTPNSPLVCCTGDSSRVSRSQDSAYPKEDSITYFCNGQPSGSRCPINKLCTSGVCVQRTCRDGLQRTNQICDDNDDCASGVCVNDVCSAGLLEPSSPCDDNNDCTSSSCAYDSYNSTSQLVCCTSESSRITKSQDSAFPKEGSSAYFCKGQPSGSRCPNNKLCASGVCVQRTCKEDLQGTNRTCDDNDDCASRVCVNDICLAGSLEPSLPCDDNNDCTSSSCAYDSYNSTSQLVCCTSESSRITKSQDSAFPKEGSSAYFCKGQPSGSRCPNNKLCASGVCVQRTCRDGLQGADEICDDNDDCASRACVNNVCEAK